VPQECLHGKCGVHLRRVYKLLGQGFITGPTDAEYPQTSVRSVFFKWVRSASWRPYGLCTRTIQGRMRFSRRYSLGSSHHPTPQNLSHPKRPPLCPIFQGLPSNRAGRAGSYGSHRVCSHLATATALSICYNHSEPIFTSRGDAHRPRSRLEMTRQFLIFTYPPWPGFRPGPRSVWQPLAGCG